MRGMQRRRVPKLTIPVGRQYKKTCNPESSDKVLQKNSIHRRIAQKQTSVKHEMFSSRVVCHLLDWAISILLRLT